MTHPPHRRWPSSQYACTNFTTNACSLTKPLGLQLLCSIKTHIRGVKNVITSPSSPDYGAVGGATDSGTNMGGVIAGIVLVLFAAIVITVIVTWKLT